MWLTRRTVLVPVVAAIAVHGTALLATHVRSGTIDHYAFQSLDCGEYHRLASNLADHAAFSQSESPPLAPDTWRTPGYPLFLAALMLVVGKSAAMLVVAQQILAVVNVVLLYLVARRCMSDRRAAIVALLYLVEPYQLLYSLWLLSTTLFVTVLLLTWHCWQTANLRGGWRWYLATGVLAGALILVRPVGLLVPILLTAGLLVAAVWPRVGLSIAQPTETRLAAAHSPRRTRWTHFIALIVGVLVVIGPWMGRNRVVAGHFALSDQGGVVMAYFKATEVELWRQGRTADRYIETSLDPARAHLPHTVWEQIDVRLRDALPGLEQHDRKALGWRTLAQGNRSRLDSFDVSRELARIGWSYFASDPLSAAACCLTRCGTILTFPLNLAISQPSESTASRLRSALTAAPYVLLCLAVLLRMTRPGVCAGHVFFPLASVAALLIASTPQIDPRFRVPMVPLMIFVALLPTQRYSASSASCSSSDQV